MTVNEFLDNKDKNDYISWDMEIKANGYSIDKMYFNDKGECCLYSKQLEEESTELKEQIEKMKCCENCTYYDRNEGEWPCDSCYDHWEWRQKEKKINDIKISKK